MVREPYEGEGEVTDRRRGSGRGRVSLEETLVVEGTDDLQGLLFWEGHIELLERRGLDGFRDVAVYELVLDDGRTGIIVTPDLHPMGASQSGVP